MQIRVSKMYCIEDSTIRQNYNVAHVQVDELHHESALVLAEQALEREGGGGVKKLDFFLSFSFCAFLVINWSQITDFLSSAKS